MPPTFTKAPLWDGLGGISQVSRSVGTGHDAGHGGEVETHHVHEAVPVRTVEMVQDVAR